MKAFRSLSLLTALAVGAIMSAAVWVVGAATHVIRATASWIGSTALALIAGPKCAEVERPTASLRGFVVHKAHQLRRIKRQAPRIEDSWRMCPSI